MYSCVRWPQPTAESFASGSNEIDFCAHPAISTLLSENVTDPTGLLILTSAVSVVVRPEAMGGNGVAATVSTAVFVAMACEMLVLAAALLGSPK